VGFISSKAYVRTSWIYGESPVESLKLNSWDNNIETSLMLIHKAVSFLYSGNGVFNGGTGTELKVVALGVPEMSIVINHGCFLLESEIGVLEDNTTIENIQVPVYNPRIDTVQIGLLNWEVSVKEGAESITPTAPPVDDNSYKLAEIYHRVGETCIKDYDDSTNGYIADCRTVFPKIT
jgi:hypothetical protein